MTWNSKVTKGIVQETKVLTHDEIVTTGAQGVAYVAINEIEAVTTFNVDGVGYQAVNRIQAWPNPRDATRQAKELEGHEITIIYCVDDPSRAYALDPMFLRRVRINAALAVGFLAIGTWVAGRLSGRYKIDQLNIRVTEVPWRKSLPWLFAVLLFLGLLIA